MGTKDGFAGERDTLSAEMTALALQDDLSLDPGVDVEDGVDVEVGVDVEAAKERSRERRSLEDGPPCAACGAPLSEIRINVDGRTLLMESCDVCDTRRWQLAGERIDLQEALNQVGEHSGRRRSRPAATTPDSES